MRILNQYYIAQTYNNILHFIALNYYTTDVIIIAQHAPPTDRMSKWLLSFLLTDERQSIYENTLTRVCVRMR